jgi:hypothetical protein
LGKYFDDCVVIQKAIPFEMTFGMLKVPLGTTRLNVIKIIAKLVATNNKNVNEELKNTGLLNKILVSNIFWFIPVLIKMSRKTMSLSPQGHGI